MIPPPPRIETERLLLRAYEPGDTDAFAALLAGSRDEYAAFIPFFLDGEPRDRVQRYADDFAASVSFSYGAFRNGRLIGGGGLFPRIGPDALEIGYHVSAQQLGRGYATEIAAALVRVGFGVCAVGRLEMHIDRDNAASLAVAQKLGFEQSGYDAEEESILIFSRVRAASESSTTSA